MAGAEALAIVHRIDENVEGITEGVQGVQVVVAGINVKLEQPPPSPGVGLAS
jgi:hypothetical protein